MATPDVYLMKHQVLRTALIVAAIGVGARSTGAEPEPAPGAALRELIATIAAAPVAFVTSAIAVHECGSESFAAIAIARRILRASRVIARAVAHSGGGGFGAYIRRQPNAIATVFRAIAVARAEWAMRTRRAKLKLSRRAIKEANQVLSRALETGRIPRRLATGLAFLRSFVSAGARGKSTDETDHSLGSGSVPLTEPTGSGGASPPEAPSTAAAAQPPASAKRGKEALPNFIWRKTELDARDTDKVPLKRIIAELKGIAEVVNKGVPLGGGVSIRPDKVEGHWGLRIMGVFAEEDEDAGDDGSEPRTKAR